MFFGVLVHTSTVYTWFPTVRQIISILFSDPLLRVITNEEEPISLAQKMKVTCIYTVYTFNAHDGVPVINRNLTLKPESGSGWRYRTSLLSTVSDNNYKNQNIYTISK